jgi:hypothetical protein
VTGIRTATLGAATVALAALRATNASAAPLGGEISKLAGDYDYKSVAERDHKPVCIERWHINEDGTLNVRSGLEVATDRFRIDSDANYHWLVLARIESNGQANCYGSGKGVPLRTHRRFIIYRNLDGDLVICLVHPLSSNRGGVVPEPYALLTRPQQSR